VTPDFDFHDLARLVWQLTGELRREAHLARRTSCSRIAPYGQDDPRGEAVRGACVDAGCLDLVHDVLIRVQPKLRARSAAAGAPDHPARYANTTITSAVADVRRSRRVELGLPAKPTRRDGVAARVEAALTPGVGGHPWPVTLFRLVRAYACTPGPAGRSWPLDAWAEAKSAADGIARTIGHPGTRDELARDVARLISVIDAVAGPAWRIRTITHPLVAGSTTTSWEEVSADDHLDNADAFDVPERAILHLFHHRYGEERATGATWQEAFRRVAHEIYGVTPDTATPAVRDAVADLDATIEPERRAA
jgi:hypothetical protein